MEDNTQLEEKSERLARLNGLINKYALSSNEKMMGNTYNVLILGESDKKDKITSKKNEEIFISNDNIALSRVNTKELIICHIDSFNSIAIKLVYYNYLQLFFLHR